MCRKSLVESDFKSKFRKCGILGAVIEHCDAFGKQNQKPQKGFLSIEDEIDSILNLNLKLKCVDLQFVSGSLVHRATTSLEPKPAKHKNRKNVF